MENWYNYYIYGMTIRINREIPYMKPLSKSKANYTIWVRYCCVDNEEIKIISCNRQYKLYLYKYAYVEIDDTQKKVVYYTPDYNHFISTFFNIPFSVLGLLNGKCLLHTSTLRYKDSLLAFCAKQGTGKSTLCSFLRDDTFKVFSDDTLSVDLNFKGDQGAGVIKLTEETLGAQAYNGEEVHININGKHCFLIIDVGVQSFQIKQLFILNRMDCDFYLKKIETKEVKKTLLYDHVVGINFFDLPLLHMVMNFIEACKIDQIEMYHLIVPNNISQLADISIKIKNELKKRYNNGYNRDGETLE